MAAVPLPDPVVPVGSAPAARTSTTTAYLLGAQFLRNLGPLLVLFFLARLTDPTTVGTYSYALAIVTPVFVLAQLGMRTVTLTLQPEAHFRSYTLVQSAGVALALVGTTVFALVGMPHLGVVILLAAFVKTADAFSDFLSGPLQRHGRSRTVFTSSLVAAVVVSGVTVTVLALTRDLADTLLALAASSLVVAYLFLFRPAHRTARAVEAEPGFAVGRPRVEMRRIVLAGLPLGIAMSVMALISTVPQYVITSSYGEAETARFAVLLYIYALADIVTGVVSQAWIPHAQARLRDPASTSTVLSLSARGAAMWTLLYVPVVALGMWAASWLVPIVFGAAYTMSLGEAVPLGLAIVLLPAAHFFATAVAIRNDYFHALALAMGATALAIASCFVLIPALGVAGAFWSLAIAAGARGVIAAGILIARRRKTHPRGL